VAEPPGLAEPPLLLALPLHAVSATIKLHKIPIANLCFARMVRSLVMSSEMPVSRTVRVGV
jgi:hypothetical protein